jgi:hypothetical protein
VDARGDDRADRASVRDAGSSRTAIVLYLVAFVVGDELPDIA